jgi:hypothetical protein
MNATRILVVFGSLAAVLWLISAVFWAFSGSVEIRDNMDAFIGDLRQAGLWNARAASVACAAAVCSVVVAICEVLRTMS